jgi:haloacetate dehalogenase
VMFGDEFQSQEIEVGDTTVFLRRGGHGPPVLLLHGFPETHVAWRAVAPRLAQQFTVFVPDLPGYGDSIGPEPDPGHERYSKRAMAASLVDMMAALGQTRFAVVGHDRGGRVAYRLALDHPARVTALAELDVIPTLDVVERTTYGTARQMTNWFWLASPSPIPERLIGADPELYLKYIVEAWNGSTAIDSDAYAEYLRCFRNPRVLHAICEEYRAGDAIDAELDRADRIARSRITCPVLVLWEQDGFVTQFGDPLAIWRTWADDVTGEAVTGGHFLMEESPEHICDRLERFLSPEPLVG